MPQALPTIWAQRLVASKESMATCEDQVVPAMPVQESEYPPNWKPQISMIETFSVARDTSEWNRLKQRVRETMQDARISKIFRIQNDICDSVHRGNGA